MELPMTKQETERYRRYLIDHYSRMSDYDFKKQFEISVNRIIASGYFSENVVRTVISEMVEEKYTKIEILAHIDMIDIQDRT